MKRILCCLLALLLVGSLCACVEIEDTQQPQTGKVEIGKDTGESQENEISPEDVTIEETVLVDESDIKITAKSLDCGGLLGTELKLLIENNSTKNLTVQTRGASVNGYMMNTMISADVAAGKKANDSIVFLSADLDLCEIETIADMECSFHIFETDNWEDYLDTDPIVVKTSAAETYTYTYDQEGTAVYEGKGVKILFKGLEEDAIMGQELVMYIHNTGDKSVTVQTSEVSVNGFMMDPLFSAEVGPGKHAISGVTFMSTELEENSIEEISDVELSFHIFNTETWDTIVDTDVVKLTFS